MNALSTLELKKTGFKKQQASRRLTIKEIFQGAKPTRAIANRPKYLLGEAVYHPRYGDGEIMAQLPDGRLQVRFQGMRRSQLIFPSFLR